MSRLAFAFGAGLLAPVNPCGFAMLPAYLGYYLGRRDQLPVRGGPLVGPVAHGLATGGAVSTGFAAVFVTAGLLVSAGMRSLMRYAPWAAVVVGAVLFGLGVTMVAGRHLGLGGLAGERLKPGRHGSLRSVVVFGAAYAVASLSCTLAILLAVVAQALATSSSVTMVLVFVAYALGAATVLTALSVSLSVTTGVVASAMRRLLPVAQRLGGALLLLSGAYLMAYWLPVLGGGRASRPVARIAEDASAVVTSWLDANRGVVVAMALVLALAGLALAVLGAGRRTTAASGERSHPSPEEGAENEQDPIGHSSDVTTTGS